MNYDHMLNGRGSRQHHQNMIKKAQYNALVKQAKQPDFKRRKASRVRAIMIALITSIMG